MAISEHLPDVQVCVRISGRTLHEYPDRGQEQQRRRNEEQSNSPKSLSRTVKNYVSILPSDSDLTYSIKLDFACEYEFEESHGFLVNFKIDGKDIGSTLVEQRQIGVGGVTIRFKGPFSPSGKKTIQHLTEFEESLSDVDARAECRCGKKYFSVLDQVGDIVVTFWQHQIPHNSSLASRRNHGELVILSDPTHATDKYKARLMRCRCDDAVEARNERTLTHFTIFEGKESTWTPALGNEAGPFPPKSVDPDAVFIFRYRSQGLLKDIGIIPSEQDFRTPSQDIDKVKMGSNSKPAYPGKTGKRAEKWKPDEARRLIAARDADRDWEDIQENLFPNRSLGAIKQYYTIAVQRLTLESSQGLKPSGPTTPSNGRGLQTPAPSTSESPSLRRGRITHTRKSLTPDFCESRHQRSRDAAFTDVKELTLDQIKKLATEQLQNELDHDLPFRTILELAKQQKPDADTDSMKFSEVLELANRQQISNRIQSSTVREMLSLAAKRAAFKTTILSTDTPPERVRGFDVKYEITMDRDNSRVPSSSRSVLSVERSNKRIRVGNDRMQNFQKRQFRNAVMGIQDEEAIELHPAFGHPSWKADDHNEDDGVIVDDGVRPEHVKAPEVEVFNVEGNGDGATKGG